MTRQTCPPQPPAASGETGTGSPAAGVRAEPVPANQDSGRGRATHPPRANDPARPEHRTISSVVLPDGQQSIACTCGYRVTDRRRRAQARYHNHGSKTPCATSPAQGPTK